MNPSAPDLDLDFYRTAYTDLAHLSPDELLGHWLASGAAEGRVGSLTHLQRENPRANLADFEAEEFLLANPDLPPMSATAAAIYYARYGLAEGRPRNLPCPPAVVLREVAQRVFGEERARGIATFAELLKAVLRDTVSGFCPEIEHLIAQERGRSLVVGLLERIHGRVPSPPEERHWATLAAEQKTAWLVASIMCQVASDPETMRILSGIETTEVAAEAASGSFRILGDYDHPVSCEEWWNRYREASGRPPSGAALTAPTPVVDSADTPIVSVICSLYCGRRFIEPYLENITGQTGFRRHELIIVDAASPEGEAEVIESFMARFPNIRYRRMERRIRIYEAWNTALRMARGRYATNANLDDSRHQDSLAAMSTALEEHPEVDLVYSDIFYTLIPHLDWDRIEAIGMRSQLPPITTLNLLEFNSPHCAPMWRRSLHDDLGFFDERFVSAGDWEFWLRCAAAGRRFHKLERPSIAYFQNPDGVSTRSDTAGIREQWPIRARYRELLLNPEAGLDPLRAPGDAIPTSP